MEWGRARRPWGRGPEQVGDVDGGTEGQVDVGGQREADGVELREKKMRMGFVCARAKTHTKAERE